MRNIKLTKACKKMILSLASVSVLISTSCISNPNSPITQGTATGAAVGAGAGALIAKKEKRTEGALIGALLGGVIGDQVGKPRAPSGYQTPQRPVYNRNSYPNNPNY